MRLQLQDSFGLQGYLRLRIKRRGQVIEEWEERNIVVDIPRDEIARCFVEGGSIMPVTHVAVGTNDLPPSRSDTQITNAFVKPILAASRPTPTSVQFDFVILPSDANGLRITEIGLLRSDGKLFARRTRGAIEKDSDLEIEGEWVILV